MEFRRAERNDLSHLLHLCRLFRTSPFSFDTDFLDLSPTRTLQPVFARDMLKAENSLTIIMEESSEIAGFITVSTNPLISGAAGKKIGSILLLVTDEKFRQRGFSKLLIQKGLTLLQNMGIFLVTVGTDLYNIPAIRAYESHGFRFRMGWHIFRFFPQNSDEITDIFEELFPSSPGMIQNFLPYLRRPVSLLREDVLETNNIKKYLGDQLLLSIERKKSEAFEIHENEKTTGIIVIREDEISRSTLRTEKNIIRISDVLVLSGSEAKAEYRLLSGLIRKTGGKELLEIWIEAENAKLIKAAEETGFRLSYSGVSLHKIISSNGNS